ncbi:MAG: ATP-dependent metallopeptidase FtsH/Yme1/Tma family protein [Verrucomicrobia bacterium]|nr:ATP-dependent metallopeptidase FtsH/Yme1/Tma family protein [Verrucomicrobiota bacterium]
MSENESKNRRRPLKNLPPERFQPKVLLIWLAIVAAVLALFFLNPGKVKAPAQLNLQKVVELAETDQIREGLIRPDTSGGRDWVVVTGETKEATLTSDSGKTAYFRASGRLTDSNLEKLQKSQKFTEQPATTLLAQIASQIIPFLLIIGLLYFLFARQLRNAGRGAMNFGKSRAKLLTRDRDRITFAEVAGCDEAKEEVAEVVEFLKDPKKFTRMGGKIPKGILLVGPPGTGKTLLAKAVAGEADVPFFSISGSDFVEMFVGVGASRVRDMFEQGRKSAPCLIFIDEIDAVGRQRGAGLGGGNDEREQTLNSMLVEMDGFDTTEGVIIIAATNRPDVLDQALLRPGRFDRQIYVDLPDLIGREQILRVHARKITLAEDVDLAVVARGTPGLSGAELANLLNESALLAARRNKKKVEMQDVDDARSKVLFGRERRRVMDDEDKKVVAYHEAGHALVSVVIGDDAMPVHKVTIIPRGRSLGSTMYIPTKDTYNYARRKMLNRLAALFGGRIAEEVAINDVTSGASGDIEQATKLARHMVCNWGMSPMGPIAYGDNQDTVFLGREITRSHTVSEETARRIDAEVKVLVDESYSRARQIIVEHRASLDKIADALLAHETIDGVHVKEIVEFGEIRSPIVREAPATPPKADDRGGKKAADSAAAPDTLGTPAPAPHPA